LNGVAMVVPRDQLAALRKLPGVVAVRRMVPATPHSNGSVAFVNAGQVWQGLAGGLQADGSGIRVGIIDTGVDYLHSHFGGSGLQADYEAIDTTSNSNGGVNYFPTAKVVGGIDLAGDAYDANSTAPSAVPQPDPNPMDCNGHGSHVAGTAAGFGVAADGSTFAGPYDAALPADLRIQPGVAPKALLYAIRVFGCDGSTDLVAAALDWALDPNGDSSMEDRLDVVNMSLGSPMGGLDDVSTEAAENAAASGMVVVASAGNSGDTYMITGAPAVSPRTISVAASMDPGDGAQVQVTAPAAIAGTYFAAAAGFGPQVPASVPANALVLAQPAIGCTPLTNAADVAGKIAVIDRGTCPFVNKVANAQVAGATAVIVVNNAIDPPFTMGGDSAGISIPSMMISQADGATIKAELAGGVSASLARGGADDMMASFSSRGPVNTTPIGLKPDLTAPGSNIVSAQTGITAGAVAGTYAYRPDNQAATLSGTSMAAPHVAGLMALLRQLHPLASVETLKALAMNGSVHDLTTEPAGAGLRYGAGRVGAGRIDAQASALATVVAYNAEQPGVVSIAFPGEVSGTLTVDRQLRIDNLGASPVTLTLAIDTVVDNPGVAFSLPDGASVSVPAGGSITLPVRMTGDASQVDINRDPTTLAQQELYFLDPIGGYWRTFGYFDRFALPEESAYLTLADGGGNSLRVPLYVAPYAASAMAAGPHLPTGGADAGSGTLTLAGIPVCTGTLDPVTPACTTAPGEVKSMVAALELQAARPRNPAIDAKRDIRHVGVAADASRLYFGLTTWGGWSQPNWSSVNLEIVLYDANDNPVYSLFPYQFENSGGNATNLYGTVLYSHGSNRYKHQLGVNLMAAGSYDARAFQNDTVLMGVDLADLPGLALGPDSTLSYDVLVYDSDNNPLDAITYLSFNLGAKGVDFGQILFDDLPGATIPVTWNKDNLVANGSYGALLLHLHNKLGSTAEVVALPGSLAASAGTPQAAAVGTAFALPLTASLTDALGNPVAGATVTFTLPASGPSGTFPGGLNTASAVTDAAGNAVSPAVTANGSLGDFTATASVVGGPAAASFTLTNVIGAPAVVLASAGSGQSATVATPFATPLQATVTDQYGHPVGGVLVTFAAPASGASGTFAGGVATATTDAGGIATAPVFTANLTAGSYVVSANAAGVVVPATFPLANDAGVASFTGPVAGGTASAAAGGGWQFAPAGNGPYQSAGFIPLSGHPKSPTAAPPNGLVFPLGLVDFVLVGGTPGSEAVVTLTFPQPVPAGAQYWKFGPTAADPEPHWYVFTGVSVSGNQATLTIVDGGLGDDDLVANGVIVDQGGPALLSPHAVPALSPWGLAALAVLVGGFGLRRRYRVARPG
jgi:subtilisin family serine protease